MHLGRVWFKTSPSSINISANFASFILIISDKVCLFFFNVESQKILSIFIPAQMLVVYMTIFFFVSSAFFITIFLMGIPNATIPYRFRANFALFFSNFSQPLSLFFVCYLYGDIST